MAKAPTQAQAKKIAQVWADWHPTPFWPDNKTMAVLVREGWVLPTGEEKEYSHGQKIMLYRESPEGLAALGRYLAK